MRIGNKLLCDECGKLIKTDNKMKKKADKLRMEGTRLNCSYTCDECLGLRAK